MWRPESYWQVSQTRNREQDQARGERYAIEAVGRSDGLNVLHSIFRDMIDAGVKREIEARKEKRSAKRDSVMFGFLHQLAKMFEPRGGGQFRAELDDAILDAELILVAARCGRKCSRPCENSTRYNRTRNFEACGHAQSKKMQKFLLRSALQPNQISFSHGLVPKKKSSARCSVNSIGC